MIFDRYVNTTDGSNGVAKYLAQQGIKKIPRKNGTNPMFSAPLVRLILDNPVYCGKIAFGRRKNEKMAGTRDKYHIVKQEEYMVYKGIHEAIIEEELWEKAQEKRKAQAKKYEHVNKGKDVKIHLLSGLLRCPVCGEGMYGNKSIKRKNGKRYKDYFYYGCKHRGMVRGHACTYKKQLQEEKLDAAVAEILSKMVSNPRFAAMMQKKINRKVDTAQVEKEIANYQKQLGQYIGTKRSLENQMDNLDVEDRHYDRKLSDLQGRLDKMYDLIDDMEGQLSACKERKKAIEAEKLTGDNIYKILVHFDRLYAVMEEADKRALLTALVKEIQIYEEEQPNGQWLKSITFLLPAVEEGREIGLDNDKHVETVCLLSNRKPDTKVRIDVDLEDYYCIKDAKKNQN